MTFDWSVDSRWRSGRDGLVHQLKPIYVKDMSPSKGTGWYVWRPMCGARRVRDRKRGKHSQPLTCLACITAASRVT